MVSALLPGLKGWLVFFVLCFLFFSFKASAEDEVTLGKLTKSLDLSLHTSYVEDVSGQYTLNELISSSGKDLWVQNTAKSLSFGYTDSVYWLKTRFVNTDDKEHTFYLEIAYPVLDYITVHILRKAGTEKVLMGDKYSFEQRPLDHRNFILPIKFLPEEHVTLVMRIKTTSSMQIPLHIYNPPDFLAHDVKMVQGLAFFYGAMIIMSIYNFFLYLSVREKNYLFYVLYVMCLVTLFASIHGTCFQFLWPHSLWWNDQVRVVAISLVAVFGLLFTAGFLKTDQTKSAVRWMFWPIVITASGFVLFSYHVPHEIIMRPSIILIVVTIIWCIIMAVIRTVQGYAPARVYLLAWMMKFGGGLVLALNKFGVVPRNSITENGTLFGAALAVALLSFALADSMNREKKERIEAQNLAHMQERNARVANENALRNERKAREAREQLFEMERKTKETLEKKVEERTRELNETLKMVKEANNHIMSSLRYASMIQQAMLALPEKINEWFPESFIWWQPRDIVGGDFYYIDAVEPGYIIAVADCTGHGVPGAFMTLIASSELKRIVRGEKCYNPSEILVRLNRRVRKTLKQNTGKAVSNDGLDIGIVVVKQNEKIIEFSGARIDLVSIASDRSLVKVDGDKKSVGYVSSGENHVYNLHRMSYEENTVFYMYTDGITDQLGAHTGKRFGTRRLLETFQQIGGPALGEQMQSLKNTMEKYRGAHDQIDDMTMVSFKIRK